MEKKKKKSSNFLNNKMDFPLLVITLLLLSLGIVMVLSASAPSALSETGNSYTYARKQFGFALVGIGIMYVVSKVDYHIYKKYYWWIYAVSCIILLFVLIPKVGVEVNGARRWVNIGFQFQPSEITKIGLIIFYAGYLEDHKKDVSDFKKGFLKPLIFLAIPVAILYFVQNHLSVSLVIAAVTFVMMIMSGCRMLHFIISGGIGSVALAFLLLFKQSSGGGGFRMDRIKTFFNPWADATETGYQLIQSLYAVGSGGLFGVGLGESKQKYLYIPEPQNDFIFAIVAEELGFVGCIGIIVLFTLFICRGIYIAMRAPDHFGSSIAVGISTLVAVQTILNIAVVTGSIPTTGMPLPFFSYGGTALLILLASVGILLNISRQTKKV